MDPTGLAPIHFLFYARSDRSFRGSFIGYLDSLKLAAARADFGLLINDFDVKRPISHPSLSSKLYNQVGHITIDMETSDLGAFGSPTGAAKINWGRAGTAFADHFVSTLNTKYPLARLQTKSILLQSCRLACGDVGTLPDGSNIATGSFGEAFAGGLKGKFTNLENIYATSYDVKTSFDDPASSFINFDISNNNRGFLRFRISAKDYYSGKFPPHFFDEPKMILSLVAAFKRGAW